MHDLDRAARRTHGPEGAVGDPLVQLVDPGGAAAQGHPRQPARAWASSARIAAPPSDVPPSLACAPPDGNRAVSSCR